MLLSLVISNLKRYTAEENMRWKLRSRRRESGEVANSVWLERKKREWSRRWVRLEIMPQDGRADGRDGRMKGKIIVFAIGIAHKRGLFYTIVCVMIYIKSK